MIQIEYGGSLAFVINMYIPPSYPTEMKEKLVQIPLEFQLQQLPYIIAGDWNMYWPSDVEVSQTRGNRYIDHIESSFLTIRSKVLYTVSDH